MRELLLPEFPGTVAYHGDILKTARTQPTISTGTLGTEDYPREGPLKRSKHLHHVAVRQHHRRVALYGLEVPPPEACRLFAGRYQLARLCDEPRGVGIRRGLVQVEGLVHEHDKLREFVEPREPWIVEHETQILSGRSDASDIALVRCALRIEQ